MKDRKWGQVISYRDDRQPAPALIEALYLAAPLERPNDDLERIARMYAKADLVLSAWDVERLVGILQALSDGAFVEYIADLAIHPDYQ